MHLISVYPIIKGNWASELQYWSKTDILPGSLIKVPLKGKEIFALVFKSASIQEAKSEIKGAGFKIRKIDNPERIDILRPEYVHAAVQASTYFVQPVGSMLKAVIPAIALDHLTPLARPAKSKNKNAASESEVAGDTAENAADKVAERETEQAETISDIVAVSTNKDDRLSVYKSLIREVLARKKSLILVGPTVRIAEELFDSTTKGIEHVSVLLHGSLSKKKMDDAWESALEGGDGQSKDNRGKIIVCTPQYMCIPRMDIETIIIEKESSRAYKTFQPPYFDWRTFAEIYTKLLGIRLMYGDQLLSIETIHRIQELEINEPFPLSFRIQKEAEVIIVDQKNHEAPVIAEGEKENIADKSKDAEFAIMSEELISMIEYAIQKEQKMFIFASRRGLSPQTVCGHCGTTVSCKHCKAPVVLHKNQKSGERYFLCHHCGKERGALEACVACNSWKLVTLGIGTDTVFEEVKKRFPNAPLYRIDKDVTKTDKEVKKAMKEFSNNEGAAILVGTELALAHLETLPYVAVASMDSLFSIPDLRIHERIAHISLRLLEVTRTYLLIQTRNADSPLIKAFFSKTLADFVHDELEVRKRLDYPPFSLMGKISLTGAADAISKQAKNIEESLKNYEPSVFPAFIPSAQGSTINILFKLPQDIWKNPVRRVQHELFLKLSAISQITPVHIQPESFI